MAEITQTVYGQDSISVYQAFLELAFYGHAIKLIDTFSETIKLQILKLTPLDDFKPLVRVDTLLVLDFGHDFIWYYRTEFGR